MAPTTSNAMATGCRNPRSGIPAAWYWPQPQIENGESRPTCQPKVRSQKTRAACAGFGSRSRIENAAAVATAKPPANKAFPETLRDSGYDHQSGTSSSAANFVQPASATNAPRAKADVVSQKPKIRNTGMIASFVFELETYCVNG